MDDRRASIVISSTAALNTDSAFPSLLVFTGLSVADTACR